MPWSSSMEKLEVFKVFNFTSLRHFVTSRFAETKRRNRGDNHEARCARALLFTEGSAENTCETCENTSPLTRLSPVKTRGTTRNPGNETLHGHGLRDTGRLCRLTAFSTTQRLNDPSSFSTFRQTSRSQMTNIFVENVQRSSFGNVVEMLVASCEFHFFTLRLCGILSVFVGFCAVPLRI